MAGKIEWIFSLLDKTSGPASTIEKKLELLEKRLKGVDKAASTARTDTQKDRLEFRKFELGMQRDALAARKAEQATGAFVMRLHAGLAVAGMVAGAVRGIASAAVGAASTVGRLTYSFARAGVEAASFKETNSLAFRTLLGSQAAADRVMAASIKFARETPFESADVMGMYKSLLTSGFQEREIPVVLKAAGDLAALNDFDKQVVDRVLLALRQIKGKGRLQGDELLQLAESGVPVGKVYERLAKIFNTTSAEAQKMMSAGRIDANTGIFAILDVLKSTSSGGQLGSLMGSISDTVPGLFAQLRSRPTEYLMELDKSGGFSAFKGALKHLNAVLDAETDAGQRIASRIERTFNRVMKGLFGDLSGPDGAAQAEALVERVIGTVDKLIAMLEVGGAAVKGFLGGFADGAGLSKILESDALNGDIDPSKLEAIADAFVSLGDAIGTVVGWMTKFVTLLSFENLKSSTSGTLLRLFDRYAEVKGQADTFQTEVDAMNAKIEAYREQHGIPSPSPTATAATVANANRASFTQTIQVDARGATAEDASAIATRVAHTSRESVEDLLERSALEAGGFATLGGKV